MIAEVQINDEPKSIINVPVNAFEISFSTFCDWTPAEEKFLAANREGRAEEAYALLTEAVAVICGPEVYKLPFTIGDDRLGPLVDEGYTIRMGETVSVLRLYAHLVSVLREELSPPLDIKEIPDHLEISHNGDQFEVLRDSSVRIITNSPLTAGETIETMEYNRRNALAVKSGNYEKSTLDFTLGLSVFAILCRKKGERLPADEGERDRWINKRRELLASISMADVMRVRFFLISALVRSTKQKSTSFLSTVRQEVKDRREVRRKKRKDKRK